MLVRCGGTVIDIGRRQLLIVISAGLVLMLVSVYSLTLIYRHHSTTSSSSSSSRDSWRIQPTPIDNLLQRRRRPRDSDSDLQQQQQRVDNDNIAADGRRHTADGLSICRSVCSHISKTTQLNFT